MLAKFAITHSGNLNDFLNKPNMSTADRACARLLLHKALQDKYKLLRSKFTDVPIEDLFMSRQERLKIKKEEQEKKKLKKKEKEDRKRKRESEKGNEKTPLQVEGDWKVEDIDLDELILNKKFVPKRNVDDDDGSEDQSDDADEVNSKSKYVVASKGEDAESDSERETHDEDSTHESGDEIQNSSADEQEQKQDADEDDHINSDLGDNAENESNSESDEETQVTEKTKESKVTKKTIETIDEVKQPNKKPVKEDNRKKLPKLKEKNKTKDFSEKILSKKSKKDSNALQIPESNKVVDPFFITATGENYMSLAEPRAPDEVKEVHKQGNRQTRRAVMFGHVPKAKPRFNNSFNNNKYNEKDSFSNNPNNNRFSDQNGKFQRQNGQGKFEKRDGYQKREFGNNNFKPNSFRDNTDSNQDRRQNFKRKFDATDSVSKISSEPEKLHPSWAAKKKMSTIQPFQGRKTVFD